MLLDRERTRGRRGRSACACAAPGVVAAVVLGAAANPALAEGHGIAVHPASNGLLPGELVELALRAPGVSPLVMQLGAVFLALVGLLVVLAVLRALRSDSQRLEHFFVQADSPWRAIVLGLVALYLAAVAMVTWGSLSILERQVTRDAGDALSTVNNVLSASLLDWHANAQRDLRLVGGHLQRISDGPSPVAWLQQDESHYRDYLRTRKAEDLLVLDGSGGVVFQLSSRGEFDSHRLSADRLDRLISGQVVLHTLPGNPEADGLWLGHVLESGTVDAAYTLVLVFDAARVLDPALEIANLQRSGENYAVSADGRMLSSSRFLGSRVRGMLVRDPAAPETPEPRSALTVMAQSLGRAEQGVGLVAYPDYRGVPVLGAWNWHESLDFGIASEIDRDEALGRFYAVRQLAFLLAGGIVVVGLLLPVLLIWLSRRTQLRLQRLVDEQTSHLRTSEQVFVQSPLAILVTDLGGTIQRVNERFVEMSGYRPEEVIGKNPRLLSSGSNDSSFYRQMWATILAGKVWQGELLNRAKDGRLYWVSVSIAPVLDAAGEVRHFVSMSVDISERKRIEVEARRANWTRDMAMDAAGLGMWSFNPMTGQWSLDERSRRMLGEPASWMDRVHSEDRQETEALMARLEASDGEIDTEIRMQRPEGGTRHFWFRGKPEGFLAGGRGAEMVGVVYDITSLREAQAETAHSQMFSALLLDSVPDPVIIVDSQARIEMVNKATEQSFGYSRDELKGQAIEILIPDRFREHHVHLRDDFLEHPFQQRLGGIGGRSALAKARSGHEFPIELSLNPIRFGDRRLVVTSLHDISDLVTANRQIEERALQFRNLVETIPGAVYQCLLDADWTMLYISDEIERLTGYPAQALLESRERTYASLIHPDDRERVTAEISAAVERKENFHLEYRIVARDGKVRHVLERGREIGHYQGGHCQLAGTLLDITERKQAERATLESERRLKATADAAGLGLWEHDLASNRILVNAHWASMLGYDPETFLEPSGDWYALPKGPEDWRALVHPDDAVRTWHQFEEHLAGRSNSFGAEFRMQCDDAEWKWIKGAGRVMERDASGQPLRVAGIHMDVDLEKDLQSQLIQARDEAEQATRAKSHFLANMSHEIRTPMNAIIGMAHLALQTDLNPRQRNYIEKVHRSGESLLSIINDILDFSKIEAGKLTIENIPFDLEDIFRKLADLVGFKAEEKGLELAFQISSDLPVTLIGDPLRLGQILLNLASNALKFTDQGEVIIGCDLVALEGRSCTLRFSVSDTGIGISEEQQGALFQSFSQADTSTTRRFGGSGLGLAISRNLCRLMGGDLAFESREGEGTTFHLTIPFQLSSEAPTRLSAGASGLANLHVLIVDDNPVSREILSALLQHMGMRVAVARSGAEAIESLAANADTDPVELVLMDWRMPGMDGIATARAIETDARLSDLPLVIMVTAFGRSEAMDASQGVSISSYLDKPVTPSSLLDAVMQAMGTQKILQRHDYSVTERMVQAVASLQGARVLLVEDNEFNQELAVELLTSNGISVVVANHGAEALQKLDEQRFDGVLMDCQMPVMDGYEATIRLRERFPDLPVIAMTANALAGDREKVLEVGMNDHIPKPIDIQQMFEVMAKWIQPGETPLRPAADPSPKSSRDPASGPASGPSPDSSPDSSPDARPATDDMPLLDGIDTRAGLQRFQNNRALYGRLLRRTASSQADFDARFQQAVAAGDWDTAQREAHTLKGLAGNVGAKDLHAAAAELEQGASRRQVDASVVAAVRAELARMLAAVAGYHEGEEEAERDPASAAEGSPEPAAVAAVLERLRERLQQFDPDAREYFEENRSLLQAALPDASFRALRKAIDGYDFDSALTVLQSWRPAGAGDDA